MIKCMVMDGFKQILCFFICAVSLEVVAADSWQMVTNKNGIKIYQQQQPGLPFKHTKGVITVKAKPAMVFALLNDFAACGEWIFGCIGGERQSDDSIYLEFEGPPFFKNREVVLFSRVDYLHESEQWVITVENQPGKQLNKNNVLIHKMQAQWLLTSLDNNELTIEHSFYIDPNVSIKLGANSYNSRAIYRTLLQLPSMLKRPKYQSEKELPEFLQELKTEPSAKFQKGI
ncbi:MAG: hypothetical protein R3E90_01370 [Marinicella sp.]|nr:hypothetical protein [Xanthomonadales bacterium]